MYINFIFFQLYVELYKRVAFRFEKRKKEIILDIGVLRLYVY